MTWREKLVRAQAAVIEAEHARSQTITDALAAGLSLREVASVLPVSFNTVRRWANHPAGPRPTVDDEVGDDD
jgi:DNA-binding NarL/FixJ family response regulator